MGHAIALDASTAPADWISVTRPQQEADFGATLMRMVAATRLGPLRIAKDFVRLSCGPGKVSFRDYNRLKLFDQHFWSGEDRRKVVGQSRSLYIWTTVNFSTDWWGFFDNKLASCSYLGLFGLPVIPNLAIYSGNVAVARDERVLTDGAALRRFLQQDAYYPLFGKPATGTQSLGSVALRRHRPDLEGVETFDGQVITLTDFIDEIARHYASGYLFQRLATPHSAIRAICGERLATIRVLTLRTGTEAPRVLRVCWKIPVGNNMADNYWRGNLLARLDPESGEVLRVVSGTGVNMTTHTHHPDTNASLIGFRLPQWQKVIATATEAARLMEQAPLIGWDIAVLDDGPVIVEMNERPDFILPQLADARGILEDPLLDFMAVQKKNIKAQVLARKQEMKTW
jgi:hypothetical protein